MCMVNFEWRNDSFFRKRFYRRAVQAFRQRTSARPCFRGGALQALLTPDIGAYNFPHFRFFQVFLSHGLIIVGALHMTIVEGNRPTGASLKRVFLWLNGYMIFVFLINLLVGGNYLFIMHKPETASLLDLFGPWPVYIFAAEGVAFITFFLLYAPFWVMDRRAALNRLE